MGLHCVLDLIKRIHDGGDHNGLIFDFPASAWAAHWLFGMEPMPLVVLVQNHIHFPLCVHEIYPPFGRAGCWRVEPLPSICQCSIVGPLEQFASKCMPFSRFPALTGPSRECVLVLFAEGCVGWVRLARLFCTSAPLSSIIEIIPRRSWSKISGSWLDRDRHGEGRIGVEGVHGGLFLYLIMYLDLEFEYLN